VHQHITEMEKQCFVTMRPSSLIRMLLVG